MLISIIIPIYNVAPYIERCLLSVLNQTYDDLEVLLIDDCGIDDSMEIARSIIANHPKQRKVKILVHEYNRGLSAARNTGIENAIGDYLFFLDSDDSLPHDAIAKLVEPTMDFNYDLVMGNTTLCYSQEAENKVILNNHIGELIDSHRIVEKFYDNAFYVIGCNKLIKKRIIVLFNIVFYESIYHEDLLWTFILFHKINSLYCINCSTYSYYIHSNSISYSLNEKNFTDKLFVLQKQLDYCANVNSVKFYNYIVNEMLTYVSLLLKSNLCDKMKRKYLDSISSLFKSVYYHHYLTMNKANYKLILLLFLPIMVSKWLLSINDKFNVIMRPHL